MRRWWTTGPVLLAVLALTGCFGGGDSSNKNTAGGPPPGAPTKFTTFGNQQIAVRTLSRGAYNKTFVLQAKDKKSGAPVCGARVTVYGQMINPHLMNLIERSLHQLKCGRYEGDYTFIMPGTWTANFVLRTKGGDASTAQLPLQIGPKKSP